MLIDRHEELDFLNRLWKSNRSELLVLYGRKRVGKSALLREFCRDKRHIYFLAFEAAEELNLTQFREAAGVSLHDPFLEAVTFPNWLAALKYTARASQAGRLLVVIDEFPYLCKSNRVIPSVLQQFWDTEGCRADLMFVLCGSHISFMENEVLGEKSPLFGLRTAQRKIEPLPYYDAAEFFPNYSAREKLKAYGMLGGVPAYLEKFDPDQSLKDNLVQQILSPGGYLRDEVTFLLRMELTEITTYASIIRAIASGATRFTQIVSRSGVPATSLGKYVSSLMALGLVERHVSMFEYAPEKRHRGRYYIADKYMNFWFRFVQQNLSLIEGEGPHVAYELRIEPYIDEYMGGIFEDVCRDFVKYRWHSVYGEHVVRVGEYWGVRFDVDIVAQLDDGRYLIGECKWWNRPVGLNVLRDLYARINQLRFEVGLGPGTRLASESCAPTADFAVDSDPASLRSPTSSASTRPRPHPAHASGSGIVIPVVFASNGFTEDLAGLGRKGIVRLVSPETLLS